MVNPVLVELTRGSLVESRHRGSLVAVDADGKVVMSSGDVDRPVFPRSSVKAIQALPLVESGAADAYGFGARELALACASHNGEPEHKQLALGMLARAGLSEDAYECGPQWPSEDHVLIDMVRRGEEASPVCNNCSGKHAGFLCTAVHLGDETRGYVQRGHVVQERVRQALEDVTGAAHSVDVCGTDGCSIPTYAVPLVSLASGFSRMATGRGLAPVRAAAARRLLEACMAEPFYVAGSKRACTRMMEAGKGEVFVKTGAEGVFCGCLPDAGIGFAVKVDDGAERASAAATAALVSKLLGVAHPLAPVFAGMADRPLKNRVGTEVGRIRATDAVS